MSAELAKRLLLDDLEARLGNPAKSVVVIGDVMLDKYLTCDVAGHSPEDELAPKLKACGVPVYKLGGAANTANNMASLGLRVCLHGYIGDDTEGDHICQLASAAGIDFRPLVSKAHPTTVKTRYVTRKGRQVVRVDRERSFEDFRSHDRVSALKKLPFPDSTPVVLSDYNKGVISAETVDCLRSCTGLACVVDPKRSFGDYRFPWLITPNEQELIFAGHGTFADRLRSAQAAADTVLVTRGRLGSLLCEAAGGGGGRWVYPVRVREVGDPAGCGDSMLAGVVFGLVHGMSMHQACAMGNACGACAMDHVGVNAVSVAELRAELRSFDYLECRPYSPEEETKHF